MRKKINTNDMVNNLLNSLPMKRPCCVEAHTEIRDALIVFLDKKEKRETQITLQYFYDQLLRPLYDDAPGMTSVLRWKRARE